MADLSYEEMRVQFEETKEKLHSREARLRELGVTDWEPQPKEVDEDEGKPTITYEELKAKLNALEDKLHINLEKPNIELCHHQRESGKPCRSAAVSGRRYCKYHLEIRGRRLRMARARARRERWRVELPPLEDLYAVQVGIQHVLEALASAQLDRQTARLMLTGLRQAANNLRLPEEVWENSPRFNKVEETIWDSFEDAHGLPEDFDVDTPPDEAFPPPATAPGVIELTGEELGSDDDLGLEDLLARDPEAGKRRASELVRRYRRKLRYDEDKLERALQLLAAAHSAAEAGKKELATVKAEAGQPDNTVVPGAADSGARKGPQADPDTKDERAEGAS
jgi:hypothetical protein